LKNNLFDLFNYFNNYLFYLKNIYTLALEMASPGNQQCASCIGTLSFDIAIPVSRKS